MKQTVVALVDEAMAAGARQRRCCEILEIPERTLQRWRVDPVDHREDPQSPPANKLSEAERKEVLDTACSPRFRDRSPKQIVAILADEGEYIASESTFYRVLRQSQLQKPREVVRTSVHKRPKEHIATGPNQVWSWDITYLRGPGRREFYYLYVVIDVWSRKIVGWAVHHEESGEFAANLVRKAVLDEAAPAGLILHSDRGAPMVSICLLAMLEHLGVRPSYSRPRVSDDNPYSEAVFRTVKYRPAFPNKPFQSLASADDWVADFVDWYNTVHRHSGIGFVTPEQRHNGEDIVVLANRRRVYEKARRRNPNRWSRHCRRWNRPKLVALNPTRETRIEMMT